MTHVFDGYLWLVATWQHEHPQRFYLNRSGMQRLGNKTFDEITVGDTIVFTPIQHPKGPRAIEAVVR